MKNSLHGKCRKSTEIQHNNHKIRDNAKQYPKILIISESWDNSTGWPMT